MPRRRSSIAALAAATALFTSCSSFVDARPHIQKAVDWRRSPSISEETTHVGSTSTATMTMYTTVYPSTSTQSSSSAKSTSTMTTTAYTTVSPSASVAPSSSSLSSTSPSSSPVQRSSSLSSSSLSSSTLSPSSLSSSTLSPSSSSLSLSTLSSSTRSPSTTPSSSASSSTNAASSSTLSSGASSSTMSSASIAKANYASQATSSSAAPVTSSTIAPVSSSSVSSSSSAVSSSDAASSVSSSSYISSVSATTTLTSSTSSAVSGTASATSSASPTTSASTSSSTSNSTNSDTSIPAADMIRGVNIGGWLILEEWMDWWVFSGTNATDQYSFDATDGAEAALQNHWSTHFTENDVAQIASWGINALRIPIGYWAYDTFGTHYIQGADAYLEQAIGWARNYGLKVLVDCHGSPGSQNGFDNSGQSGGVDWQVGENMANSLSVLETMATKYGAMEYADVVMGLELVNEPISWAENNFTLTQVWAMDAYKSVKAKAANPDFMVIMHDGFMGPFDWEQVGADLNGANTPKTSATFALDVHLYQNQDASWDVYDQPGHIEAACNWTTDYLLPTNAQMPVFVGEFASGTNICANPDGTTTAGTTCDVEGCQCSATQDVATYSDQLTMWTRKYVEAQLDAFEHSSNGWFIWSYQGPGGWGLDTMISAGLIGNPVTERLYPAQCGFSSD